MIALGGDHAGFGLKGEIKAFLDELGVGYRDYGVFSEERCDYPEYALAAARAVAGGECEKGILFCGTGVGISIAANKVRGIRCAVCGDPCSAQLSRRHNDANMLALGGRIIGPELARMIVKAWLDAGFEGGRHAERVAMITEIENNNQLT
ncbi:MAG: ribose 5-phosphate isomerase B [Oscillospiraceae bacterium]|nr:ribose 5-phosphate isomerase B [Oscillospiraceae bacterium]